MSPSPSVTQSAADRRVAEGELRKLIARFAPAHRRLISTTRRWLRTRVPTANELVYEYRDCFVSSFSPSEHGYEGVLGIRGSADGVRLYVSVGKGAPDPERLLRGSGTKARYIDVGSASVLSRPAVVQLVEEALARNRVPFARAGKGAVIARSVGATKRRRRTAVRHTT